MWHRLPALPAKFISKLPMRCGGSTKPLDLNLTHARRCGDFCGEYLHGRAL